MFLHCSYTGTAFAVRKVPFSLLAVVVFCCAHARRHHFLFYSSGVELLHLFQDQVFVVFMLEKIPYLSTLALL